MKISLNWLKDYVALDASIEELKHAITFLGFEVEGVHHTGAPKLEHVVVGEVLTRDKHPNADKLSVCTVDIGPAGGVKTIVCGAQNYKVGDRVPVALPGAVLPGDFKIKQSKIRGQLSDGMMCSAKELGIAEDADGLLILEGRPALGAPINDVLPAGDVVFDVEITPNRPDGLSHLGLARELAAWFKRDLVYPQVKFNGHPPDAAPHPDLLSSVNVEVGEDCPLYSATILAGVKIAPSPVWLQERLKAVGLRPINNVVDVGNYVMLESGQPMHAFDARKIAGRKIIVRRAADGEKLVTLDGKERALSSRMLVIADAEKPLVVAGIMGGANAGVDETTTDLVLEVAYFKPQSIRWTSKRLGLASDSSYRYERGVDPHMALEASHRAIDLLLETAGGRVVGPLHQVGGDVPWKREIVVTPAFIRRKLGFEIPAAEMKAALESLELKIAREDDMPFGPQWTVSIPSWRGDLDRPIDLVEEVLRLHGSDKVPASPVLVPGLVGDDDPVVAFTRRVTDYFVGQHFHECVNYTLRSRQELQTWVSQTSAQELALANPLVEDMSHLRSTLAMGLLDTVKLNQSRGVAISRVFETGRVFVECDGQIFEAACAAFVLVQNDSDRAWLHREPPDFYTAKRHVEIIAGAAGMDFAQQPLTAALGPYYGWQEGHSAAAGDLLGDGWTVRFGLLNLAMVQALGLEGKIYCGVFSILPEKLAVAPARRRYADFSLFPAALRDLALVVDTAAPAGDIRARLAQSARAAVGSAFAVESVEVFDVYRGQGLPEGKKSLAFSFVFRAANRTLTDDEVNAAFQKIQDDVVKTAGYAIRK
ncbi:MAG TPA: phenylalanine--tRNA ligase subunit beta [Opitutaceae bacterium]|jgi:phenylalanyl-tRNA synthetase beta chain|nr:phenylalanine--tRNA ligase subunit beta [Opitutaceae bacterium]